MKILLATQKPFAAAAVNGIRSILEEAGNEVVLLEKYAGEDELVAAVADVDAMIIRSDKVTARVLDAAPKLKIVVRAGHSIFHFPHATARRYLRLPQRPYYPGRPEDGNI